MVARPLAGAEPTLPRLSSKQQSKLKQFVVECIYKVPPGVMVHDKNRSTMTAAQAAFCGRPDLPHFAAVTRMSNKRRLAAAPRTLLRKANPRRHAFETGERLEGWKQIAAYLKRGARRIQRWGGANEFRVGRK